MKYFFQSFLIVSFLVVSTAFCKASTNILNDTLIIEGDAMRISWSTIVESQNREFKILRSYDSITWLEIASLPGLEQSNVLINYTFLDTEANFKEKKIYYQLCDINVLDVKNCFTPIWYDLGENIFHKVKTTKPSLSTSFDESKKTVSFTINNFQEGRFYQVIVSNEEGKEVLKKTLTDALTIAETKDFVPGLYTVDFYINRTNFGSQKFTLSGK